MTGVFHILSLLLGVAGFALLVPAVIGISAGDPAGILFLIVAGLVGFVAGAVFFSLSGQRRDLSRVNSVTLVVLAWTVLPMVSALPIAIATQVSPLDAMFEATSGLTTTGATVYPSVSGLGPAVLFWRAELQWLGGMLTLVTFTTIIAPLGVGGLSARGLALIGRREWGMGRVLQLIGGVVSIYVAGTGVCVLALSMAGLPAFDAFCVGLATVATGGFLPRDGVLGDYGSAAASAIVAVFMIVGATSVVWHRAFIDRRHARNTDHTESYWVIGVMLVVGLGFAAVYFATESPLAALGTGLFAAISVISTTGYQLTPETLPALPGAVVVFLALAGGAALSTAGGIKLYRIGALVAQSGRELHRLVFPNSVRSARFGGIVHNPRILTAIWANIAVSMLVIGATALILALQMKSLSAAFTAAISAFSNIGPLYAAERAAEADWLAIGDFDAVSKSAMIAAMILGRLEVFVFVAILRINDWRS